MVVMGPLLMTQVSEALAFDRMNQCLLENLKIMHVN